jgi:hypothetical protein
MLVLVSLFACSYSCTTAPVVEVGDNDVSDVSQPVEVLVAEKAAAGDCTQAKNECPDYAPSWVPVCPEGARCVTFKNSCDYVVGLSYQIGCNGDGTKGAPQCDCTMGPVLPAKTGTASFVITDGDYASCLPSWQPPCLTAGLAVMAGKLEVADATAGVCSGPVTRFEFSAGNTADPYGHFDSYDIDLEKGYGVPMSVTPELQCAHDVANHDCRPLVCDSATCPDAYLTPTSGSCPDGRSPQVGCQDTFSQDVGVVVELCPEPVPASCQDATACP